MKKLLLTALMALSFMVVIQKDAPMPDCGAPGADPCPWVR